MATIWGGAGTTNTTPASHVPVTADVYRYVNKIGTDGWLKTATGLPKPNDFLYLCKYTKVMLLNSKEGRTYFKVMDGAGAGKTVSLTDANTKEYLGKTPPKQSAVEVVVTYGKYVNDWASVARGGELLQQQMATMSVSGVTVSITMNSIWREDLVYKWNPSMFPIPAGEYRILLPDAPHKSNSTRFYRDTEPTLIHDQVWFPIEFGANDRFVHVGNLSEGCTTILDLEKWSGIHETLISHRAADGKSVGKLIVKGKPERTK